VTSVAISPTEQVLPPSPPGHLAVNVAAVPDSELVRATVTPLTGPFCTKTCTDQVAAWPAAMLSADA
jgi:hypothetical protein